MSRTLYYMAHDPVGNSEAVLTEYDAELIARAAESGIVFVAVDEDGGRTVVPPDEVEEPVLDGEPFTLVQPSYVDERMVAVVGVFDALAANTVATPMTMSSVKGERAATAPADGTKSFTEALAALKAIVFGGDGGR